MLYLDHDFYSNFNSGINSGDNELISDMVVNELSELIVYKTKKVIDLLNHIGIKTNEKASDEKIVDNIITNLSTNEKLNKGLAFLIAENNDATKTKQIIKGKDGKEKEVRRRTKGATVREIDSIASGIMGIGASFTHKPQLQKEFKISLMKKIETKSTAVGERDRKHTNNTNGKYWLLAILVVGASIGIYFYLKNKKKKASEGMLVDGVEPTPEVVAPSEVAPIPMETPSVEAVAQPTVEPVIAEAPTDVVV
jgi:hypothetical protein